MATRYPSGFPPSGLLRSTRPRWFSYTAGASSAAPSNRRNKSGVTRPFQTHTLPPDLFRFWVRRCGHSGRMGVKKKVTAATMQRTTVEMMP